MEIKSHALQTRDLSGYTVEKLAYRGNDIFSISLFKNDNFVGINLINCFYLDDNGFIGKTITHIKVSSLGSKHIFICQKLQLNPLDYRSLWIKTLGHNNIESELFAAIKSIEVNDDIHLFNPISEDKY